VLTKIMLVMVNVALLPGSPPPPPGNPPIEIVSSSPPHGAIDARQPSNPDGSNPTGWTSIVLTFTGSTSGLLPKHIGISSTSGTPPTVSSVVPNGVNVTVNFSGRIPPGAWTTIKHHSSATQVVLGYLPADVNADGTSNSADTQALIDHLNGVVTYPIWQTDMDRSGATTSADILTHVDLLNGAGGFDPWNGVSLGAQPQPGSCTPGRKYAQAIKTGTATGCSAAIRTRATVLCGEPTETQPAQSGAYAGVTNFLERRPKNGLKSVI